MFRREPYESVSPLVKAILAVAAGGERYRLGHYGAITKVPRGTLQAKGWCSPLVESHIDEGTENVAFPIPAFQEASCRYSLPGGDQGRLGRLRGAGGFVATAAAWTTTVDKSFLAQSPDREMKDKGWRDGSDSAQSTPSPVYSTDAPHRCHRNVAPFGHAARWRSLTRLGRSDATLT